MSLTPLTAAELTLVRDGRALSEIVLPGEPTEVEHYAAKEIQRAIRLSTGAELSIREGEPSAENLKVIVIGSSKNISQPEAPKVTFTDPASDDDQIAIHQTEDALYLTGSNARSALYATYRFLEESLNFRWYWPGETGEFFEKKSNLTLNNLSLNESGALRYRYLTINSPHYDHDTLVWMSRNRMNIHIAGRYLNAEKYENLHEKGFIIRYSGHTLGLPREIFEEHPEYAAEYAGRRTIDTPNHPPHLCWSDPGVQQALIGQITRLVRSNQRIGMLGIFPTDQTQFCQCAKCEEMSPDVSTRYQKLWKILIEGLRPEFPELKYSSLAYQAYRAVPKEIAPFDMFQYAAYNVSYRHPFLSGHPSNATALREMKEWKALGMKNVGLRGYEMIPFNEAMFFPGVTYVVDEMAFLKQNGLTVYKTEVSPYYSGNDNHGNPPHKTRWVTNRLNLYSIGRSMWEESVTPEAIVADWTRTIYGPKAGEAMKRYYFAMEKAWLNAPGDIAYFGNPAAPYARGFITVDLIAEVEAAFSEARQHLVAEQDARLRERALAQVQLEEAMFGEWKACYQLLQENADHYQVSAALTDATDKELMDPDFHGWKDAPKLPGFRNAKAAVPDATEVSLLWKDGTLYLRALCHERSSYERVARITEHDKEVWGDDSLELFINPEVGGGYYHLAVNPLGTRYDAFSKAGMNLDITANPDWKAAVADGEKQWKAVIALPLKEFQISGTGESEVHLTVMRTRAGGGAASGWPSTAYHSPSSYGVIRLAEEQAPSALFYNGGNPPPHALEMELRKRGWTVDYVDQDEDAIPEETKLILVRYGTGVGFNISADYIRQTLMPWIEAGGTLVISACNRIPYQQWFEDDSLAVTWSGWKISPQRRSDSLTDGAWLEKPHNLRPLLKRGVTPSSGFQPLYDGWEVLATLPMRDESTVPYLLKAKLGSGQLYLTSSDMTYGGGHEIFGSANPENAANLIENLYRSSEIIL